MERDTSKTFQDIIAWQKAHQLVLSVYSYCDRFPKNQTYVLIPQFTRSAISVAANIAEGFKRRTKTEKLRFLNISQASLEETRYYLILSQDLGYGNMQSLMENLDEVSKLLYAYSKAIKISNV